MKTEHGESFFALLRGEVSQSLVWKPVKIDQGELRGRGLLRPPWPERLEVLPSRRPPGGGVSSKMASPTRSSDRYNARLVSFFVVAFPIASRGWLKGLEYVQVSVGSAQHVWRQEQ